LRYIIENGEIDKYDANQLYSLSLEDNYVDNDNNLEENYEIIDFCLFDEKSILIGLSFGKLCLFNIENGTI